MAAGPSMNNQAFNQFYDEVKQIEQADSTLTSKDQINRLLRPGSTYFNLNPFEVLQVPPDTPVEMIKKKYKRMSILIHPDKNPDDRERADKAFDIIKKAMTTVEDPDELDRCLKVVEEATARTALMVEEKRRRLKREGKPPIVEEDDPARLKQAVHVLTTKIFADQERKRQQMAERANEEKVRKINEEQEQADLRQVQEQYNKTFEDTRDERVGSWNKFKSNKKKSKVRGLTFKPPKPKLESSSQRK